MSVCHAFSSYLTSCEPYVAFIFESQGIWQQTKANN